MAETGSSGEREGSMANRTYNQTFPAHSNYMLEQLNVQRYLGAFTDIVVRIGDVDFKLHRCMLAAACARFQSLLCNMREECGNVLVLKTVTPAGFRNVADFIYTGVVKLDEAVAQDALAAAQFFEMKDLEKVVLDYFKSVGSDAPMPPTEAALSLMRMSQGIGLNNTAGGADSEQVSKFPPLPPPTWSHSKEGHPPFFPNMSNSEGNYFEDYLKMIESFEAQQGGPSEYTNQQKQEYLKQLSARVHKSFKDVAQYQQSGSSKTPGAQGKHRVENGRNAQNDYRSSNNFQDDASVSSRDEDDDCEVLCETGDIGDQAAASEGQGLVGSRDGTPGPATIKQERADEDEQGHFDSCGRREIAVQTITASFITRMKKKEFERITGMKAPKLARKKKKVPTATLR